MAETATPALPNLPNGPLDERDTDVPPLRLCPHVQVLKGHRVEVAALEQGQVFQTRGLSQDFSLPAANAL